MAFKPVKIGQHSFLDEGAMNYNPAPQALDEAVLNEWPGREVGVFVSIGTGKRSPSSIKTNQQEWWEGIVGSGVSQFAEARRRLITKIDGCEETHKYMISEHLARRGVKPDRYIRLNVNVGVGGFRMNEWNRLGEISTSTRMYLGKDEIQRSTLSAARKLAKLWVYHQQDMIRRTFSRSASMAPSFTSSRGYEEDGYFSDDYLNRLPCCPEDDEMSQVPSDSPGSNSPNPMSPTNGSGGYPDRNLRRKHRYTMPLRLSTSVDGQGFDNSITEYGEAQQLPPPSVHLPTAFGNSRTDTTRTWSVSDIPQPLNVERKTSDATGRSRSPQVSDEPATSQHASETGSLPRHMRPVPANQGAMDSPTARQRSESTPMPHATPYQELRRQHQRTQAPFDSRQGSPLPYPNSNRSSRSGLQSGRRTDFDPDEVAPFNEYTAIIPPYPVEDNDSILQIPDVNSTRSSSRMSAAMAHQLHNNNNNNNRMNPEPTDRLPEPSNEVPVAMPTPPPRAPGRLYSANIPAARFPSGQAPNTADRDSRHRRRVSSVTSNPPTIFSAVDSGESAASTPTTLTASAPHHSIRSRSTGNDNKNDGEPNPGSTLAVVNGDVDSHVRRPATSGGESATYHEAGDQHNVPVTVNQDGPWKRDEQRPTVNRERKPTLLS